MAAQHVNGWELIDTDSLLYFKTMPDGITLIDMTWLDTTRQDPEYGTGREYVVCVSTEDTEDLEEAEAEQIIMEYIETHWNLCQGKHSLAFFTHFTILVINYH